MSRDRLLLPPVHRHHRHDLEIRQILNHQPPIKHPSTLIPRQKSPRQKSPHQESPRQKTRITDPTPTLNRRIQTLPNPPSPHPPHPQNDAPHLPPQVQAPLNPRPKTATPPLPPASWLSPSAAKPQHKSLNR